MRFHNEYMSSFFVVNWSIDFFLSRFSLSLCYKRRKKFHLKNMHHNLHRNAMKSLQKKSDDDEITSKELKSCNSEMSLRSDGRWQKPWLLLLVMRNAKFISGLTNSHRHKWGLSIEILRDRKVFFPSTAEWISVRHFFNSGATNWNGNKLIKFAFFAFRSECRCAREKKKLALVVA